MNISNAQAAYATLLAHGQPLGTLADGQIYQGIAVPLPAAFVIDKPTRDRLAIVDPASARLLRRFVRAADLRPWHHAALEHYLIAFPPGWTAAQFGEGRAADAAWAQVGAKHPALVRQLAPWAEHACAVQPDGYWWELPPHPVHATLEQPKIVWPLHADQPCVAPVAAGCYVDDSACFMPFDAPALLALLGSRAWWFVATFGHHAPIARGPELAAGLPVPAASDDAFAALGALATALGNASNARSALQRSVRRRIRNDLGPPGARLSPALQRWWALDFDGLLAEINRALGNDIPWRVRDEWRDWFGEQCDARARHSATIAHTENDLNQHVYAMFGLSAGQVAAMDEA